MRVFSRQGAKASKKRPAANGICRFLNTPSYPRKTITSRESLRDASSPNPMRPPSANFDPSSAGARSGILHHAVFHFFKNRWPEGDIPARHCFRVDTAQFFA